MFHFCGGRGTAKEIAQRPSLPQTRLHETSLTVVLSLRLGNRGWIKPESGKAPDLGRRAQGRVGEGRNNLRSHFVLAPLPSSLPGLPPPSGSSFRLPRVPRGTDRAEPCSHWSVANVPALLRGHPSAPSRLRGRVAQAYSLPTLSHPPAALSDRGLPRAGSGSPAFPFPPGPFRERGRA